MQPQPREVTQWLRVPSAARELDLARSKPPRRQFFQHCAVSGFGLIGSIKGKSLPVSAARMRTNPGVFVSKPPSLNRRAARAIQARFYNAAIDVGLSAQVLNARLAGL